MIKIFHHISSNTVLCTVKYMWPLVQHICWITKIIIRVSQPYVSIDCVFTPIIFMVKCSTLRKKKSKMFAWNYRQLIDSIWIHQHLNSLVYRFYTKIFIFIRKQHIQVLQFVFQKLTFHFSKQKEQYHVEILKTVEYILITKL